MPRSQRAAPGTCTCLSRALVLVVSAGLCAAMAAGETLLYACFDQSLTADYAVGDPAPLGADAAVITIFTELTAGGKGVPKPAGAPGEALNLAGEQGTTSALSFNVEGNLSTSQGTFQCWVSPLFDAVMHERDEQRCLFRAKTRGGRWHSISAGIRNYYYAEKPIGPILFFHIFDGASHFLKLSLSEANWKRDTWHHVLVQWSSERMEVYLDGRLGAGRDFPADKPYSPTPAEGPIVLGDAGGLGDGEPSKRFPLYLDEVRIDDRPLVKGSAYDPWQLPGIEKARAAEGVHRPVLPCARTQAPPRVDGDLSDEAWQRTVHVGGFSPLMALTDFRLADVQTVVQACCDNDNLYLAAICLEPSMKDVSRPSREHDGELWQDEAIEVYLCADEGNPRVLHHFLVNVAGATADRKAGDWSWDNPWSAATRRGEDRWLLEVAIPWSTLGRAAPAAGQELPINVARNRHVQGLDLSSLAIVGDSFAMIPQFGSLRFMGEPGAMGFEAQTNAFFLNNAARVLAQARATIAAETRIAGSLPAARGGPQADALARIRARVAAIEENLAGDAGVLAYAEALTWLSALQAEAQAASAQAFAHASLVTLKAPDESVVVLGQDPQFVVFRSNGALLGVKQGARILCRSATDRYWFEPREGTKQTLDERADQVVQGSLQAGGNTVSCRCANEEMPGIEISKAYTLLSDRILAKRVEFRKTAGPDCKVSGVTRLVLDEGFRTGGLYGRPPAPLGSPQELPFVLADEINADHPRMMVRTWTANEGDSFVLFTGRDRTAGLAQYQTRINDRFVYPPKAFEMTYITQDGWECSWFAGVLKEDTPASCETRYHVFDGDRMGLHREYLETSGMTEALSGWEPISWAPRIRWNRPLMWLTPPDDYLERFDRRWEERAALYAKLGRPGDLAIDTERVTFRFGDLPVADDSLVSFNAALSGSNPARAYTERIGVYASRLRRSGSLDTPFVTAAYVWPWAICESAGLHATHPEWFLHDRDVSLALDSTAFGASMGLDLYMAHYGAQGCAEWQVNHMMQMVDYLNLRVHYTDGSVSGPRVDWRTMTMSCQADGLRFCKLLAQECRKRNTMYFANSGGWRPVPGLDIVWFESVSTVMRPEWTDWRRTAEAMALCKLYTPPCVIPAMLYWNRPGNFLAFIKTMVMLGMLSDQSEYAPEVVEPYIQTAHEMYGYSLVDVGLRPCYWMEDTEVEAYALRREGDEGVLLTVCNHDAQPADVTLSLDAGAAGLDAGKQVYAWYGDARSFDAPEEGPSPELFIWRDASSRCSVADGRMTVSLTGLEPEVAKHVYVTNSPALVWAIAGQKTQVKATTVLGASVRTTGAGRFRVEAARPTSVLLTLPHIRAILVDEARVATREERIQATVGAVFDVARGAHTVEVVVGDGP